MEKKKFLPENLYFILQQYNSAGTGTYTESDMKVFL